MKTIYDSKKGERHNIEGELVTLSRNETIHAGNKVIHLCQVKEHVRVLFAFNKPLVGARMGGRA